MTTPLAPTPSSEQLPPDELLQTPPVETPTQQQVTSDQQPPTTNSIPSIRGQVDPLIQAAMRDLYQENKALQQQLAQVQTAKQEKPTFDSFMADPQTLIEQAVARQIAPVIDSMRQYSRVSAYDNLKKQFKSHPQYAAAVQQYEAAIDELMANAEPTEQNFNAAMIAAAGRAALFGPFNVLPNTQGVPPVTQQNTGQPYVPGQVTQAAQAQAIPGQARPTPPPAPIRQAEPELRQPTENERRVMRSFGFDPSNKEHLKAYYAEMAQDMMQLSDHPIQKETK